MRKYKTLLFLLCMAFIVCFIRDQKACAATIDGEKALKENTSYSYDLDGDGKKEKLKYVTKSNEEERKVEVALYINGTRKYKAAFDGLAAYYSITDLNAKDKKLDLFLTCTSESACLEYGYFQQYDNKAVKTIKMFGNFMNRKKFGNAKIYRIAGLGQIKKDGSFSIIADTPVYLSEIGSYFCYVPFQIKNGKITHKKVDSYVLDSFSQDYLYTANETIAVYQKADQASEKITTLRAGDTLRVKSFKLPGDYAEDNPCAYASILYGDGKKGWIYLPNTYDWNHPMFKSVPGWG